MKCKEELAQMRDSLSKVITWYSEKRSDVADILQGILDGNSPNEDFVEHRYVKWTHNGTDFLYDTLTTLVDYRDEDDEWHTIEGIRYEDD